MEESAVEEDRRLAKLATCYGVLVRQMALLQALESVWKIPMRVDGAYKRAFDLRGIVALDVLENCERIYELSEPPADDSAPPW